MLPNNVCTSGIDDNSLLGSSNNFCIPFEISASHVSTVNNSYNSNESIVQSDCSYNAGALFYRSRVLSAVPCSKHKQQVKQKRHVVATNVTTSQSFPDQQRASRCKSRLDHYYDLKLADIEKN